MSQILMMTLAAHLAAGFACAQVPKLEFQPVTSVAGTFSAVMPGNPKHETEEIVTPVGTLQMHKSVVAVSENLVYMIAFIDYPAAIFVANDAETILMAGRDGLLTEKRKLIEDKEVTLGKDKSLGVRS